MLFKTTDDFKKAYRVGLSLDFEKDLESAIRTTERQVLPSILDSATITALQSSYDTASQVVANMSPAKYKNLIPWVRDVVAPFAFIQILPTLNGISSQGGLFVPAEGPNAAAPKWMYDEQLLKAEEAAWAAVERLYGYMEDNKSDFTSWTSSDQYSEFKNGFITSAVQFDKYVKIRKSRLLFVQLVPIMKRVEEYTLKPLMGAGLFDQIKTQLLADNLSTANKKLMEPIYNAVSTLTMAAAIDILNLRFDGSGVTVHQSTTSNETTGKIQANEEAKKKHKDMMQYTGDMVLSNLAEYLKENHASYPLYEASTAYMPDNSSTFTNSSDGKSFGFF